MKRFIILIILLLLLVHSGFSQDRGIVSTNTLRIRSAPSINSQIVGTTHFCDIIHIYDISGTNQIVGNIFDLWYKISETEEKWVNAFYINKFPFYLNSATTRSTHGYMSSIYIIDYYVRDNNQYILCDENRYRNGQYELFFRNAMLIEEDYHFSLMNNFSNRIYQLFYSLLEKTSGDLIRTIDIRNGDIILEYGIGYGTPKEDLIFIFGEPYDTLNNKLTYAVYEGIAGYTSFIHFCFESNNLSNIELYLER